jgi:hypothetical protein
MSKLMWLLGMLLIAAGVALGVKGYTAPGQLDVLGLRLDTAASLVVGGILSLGLGSVIDGLAQLRNSPPTAKEVVVREEIIETTVPKATNVRIPGFGRKGLEAVAATAAVASTAITEAKSTVNSVAPVVTGSVTDTIAALEQAKSDIKNALGGVESLASPAEEMRPVHVEQEIPAPAMAEPEEDAPLEDGELFVVEERIIRGRPSRILSDDTVEAETDEGWMRFENIEHLNEYLDSMEPNEI